MADVRVTVTCHPVTGCVTVTRCLGSRRFAPLEERALAKQSGAAWRAYCRNVVLPWR